MEVDHKNAHLAWLNETKGFICRYPADYSVPYIQVMASLYADPRITQSMAEAMYIGDKAWYLRSKKIAKEIDKKVAELEAPLTNTWFFTFSFNHETFTPEKADKCIKKILNMSWITKAKANLEFHRENGDLHPHFHILFETAEPISRIKEKLWRPNYVKELIKSTGNRFPNFIEYEKARDYHIKYINLDKKPEKLAAVEKDKVWRLENNIPDYEKNW